MAKPHHLILLLLILLVTLQSSPTFVSASPSNHIYNVGQNVPFFVNKLGPFNNPSETYQYYQLPFCKPDPIVEKKESLGEVLNGDRLTNGLYEFKFREDKIDETLCKQKLTVDEIGTFKQAINNEFYFQFYLDDLPFWGFIGKLEDESFSHDGEGLKYYLFTHVQFDVLYNGNGVVEVKAFGDPNRAVDITKDVEINNVKFSYSVIWNNTELHFENRMERYSRASLLPLYRQVHWFSFVNSIVIILLLVGLLALIYSRHLKSDMKKYSSANEEDREVGWKSIHGDVFKHPPNSSLLFAVVGTGTQLLILLCVILFLAFIGTLYPYNRGGLSNCLVFIFTLSSVFAGYSTASFHGQFAEDGWERSVGLAGILYIGPVFVTFSILNVIAISYRVTARLPLGSIIVILCLFAFVAIPLLAFGGVIGYRLRSKFQVPSATKRYSKEIQPLPWYRRTPFQMFIGGFVPFSAIVLQLHQVYASMWGYKIFTLPGILVVTLITVIVIIALVNIGLTYIQLSEEDHHWWWRSVLCGGSPAIFMFAYCIYFYARSRMSGFLQLSFFIGYNACICYAFFLIFGAISFRVSLLFVRHIYHNVKRE